jgi:hypothetical protein
MPRNIVTYKNILCEKNKIIYVNQMCPIVEKISKKIVRYYYTFACPNSKARRKKWGQRADLEKKTFVAILLYSLH